SIPKPWQNTQPVPVRVPRGSARTPRSDAPAAESLTKVSRISSRRSVLEARRTSVCSRTPLASLSTAGRVHAGEREEVGHLELSGDLAGALWERGRPGGVEDEERRRIGLQQ